MVAQQQREGGLVVAVLVARVARRRDAGVAVQRALHHGLQQQPLRSAAGHVPCVLSAVWAGRKRSVRLCICAARHVACELSVVMAHGNGSARGCVGLARSRTAHPSAHPARPTLHSRRTEGLQLDPLVLGVRHVEEAPRVALRKVPQRPALPHTHVARGSRARGVKCHVSCMGSDGYRAQ